MAMHNNLHTQVVLVNEWDEEIGTMDKMEAHVQALLHRAISVVVLNQHNEILLQQRSDSKYHSPLLWTNTCCTHPFPNEVVEVAALRRLKEEMGFETELTKAFEFMYKAELDNNLTEFEYDHVFIGIYNEEVLPNPHEVFAFKYMAIDKVVTDMRLHPENYTEWFKILMPKLIHYLVHNTNV